MASRVDFEKYELVRIANSQEPYNGPTKDIEITKVDFEKNSNTITIYYDVVKGKKTIAKRFSYNSQQYKIYSDWSYTRTPKTKKLVLTNEILENLNTNSDEIISKALPKIIPVIPYKLTPSWLKKKRIEEKYENMIEKKVQEIQSSYEEQINSLNSTINSYNIKKGELQINIENYQSQIAQNEKTIEKNTSYIERKEKSLFKSFCKNKIEKKTLDITQLQNENERLSYQIKQIGVELTTLNTYYQDYTLRLREVNNEMVIKISREKSSLISQKSEALSEVQPLTSLNQSKRGSAAPDSFINEERKKLGRVYKDGLTLRDFILKRDNYTCQYCGNSIKKEPNLLLEVDHICPVSKWGPSVPENLETLCWKCNRSKSNK